MKLASQDIISEIPVCCEPSPASRLEPPSHPPGASLLSSPAMVHPETLRPESPRTPQLTCSGCSWLPQPPAAAVPPLLWAPAFGIPSFPLACLFSLLLKKTKLEMRMKIRTGPTEEPSASDRSFRIGVLRCLGWDRVARVPRCRFHVVYQP